MKKGKKIILLSMVVFSIWSCLVSVSVSLADNEDKGHKESDWHKYEDNDDDHKTPAVVEVVTAPVAVVQSVPTTTYKTVTDPSTTVTEWQDQTINKKDTDRDGLLDEIDPHPTIAEYYIVQDNDYDGINDALQYATK